MEQSKKRLPASLGIFQWTAIVSFAATVVIVLSARYLGLHYPYNWPLLKPGGTFDDLYEFFRHRDLFLTRDGLQHFTYMPSGILLYRSYYIFGRDGALAVYMLEVLTALFFAIRGIQRAMTRRGIAVDSSSSFLFSLLLCGSFPLIFGMERCNIEIIIAIGMAVGTWAYMRGNLTAAAILWGLFGSIKLYPLFLFGIFLARRQYRALFIGIAAAVGITAIATVLAPHGADSGVHAAHQGLGHIVDRYVVHYIEWISFDHSLFAMLKILFVHSAVSPSSMLPPYLVVCAVAGITAYALRIRKLPIANQFIALTAFSLLLAPVSYDYTLTQLYAPFVILVFVCIDAQQEGLRLPALIPTFVLFALLFTPTNFLFIHGIGYAGQIKCVALLALATLSILNPWPATASSTRPTEVMAGAA